MKISTSKSGGYSIPAPKKKDDRFNTDGIKTAVLIWCECFITDLIIAEKYPSVGYTISKLKPFNDIFLAEYDIRLKPYDIFAKQI